MDNDWDSVLQYVGDLDLDYNEKVAQADEGSLTMQVPTPPVSILSSSPFSFLCANTPFQSNLKMVHLSLTIKKKPALSFQFPPLFFLDLSTFPPRLILSF